LDQPATQLSFPVDDNDAKIESNCLQRTALDDINYLANPELQGRRAGTSGEGLAADYLSEQLLGLGLEPMGEHGTFIQAFTIPAMNAVVANGRVTFRSTGREALRAPCANVCGGLRGDNLAEVIILSAHYDHVGVFQGKLYPGANDNASGVGCVLDVMRRLVREGQKPKRTVMAAFWSAEEMGFLGSMAFVQRPTVPLTQIQAVLNIDTVGNGEAGDFSLWGTNNLATDTVQTAALKVGARATVTREGHNSDQITFAQVHIPAVTLLSRTWLQLNHTPDDVPAAINKEQLDLASELIYQAVHQLAW